MFFQKKELNDSLIFFFSKKENQKIIKQKIKKNFINGKFRKLTDIIRDPNLLKMSYYYEKKKIKENKSTNFFFLLSENLKKGTYTFISKHYKLNKKFKMIDTKSTQEKVILEHI
jgi:hypothetical protein